MRVLLENKVNYLQKINEVSHDPQEGTVDQQNMKMRSILKVPTLWEDDPTINGFEDILEKKLAPSCFVEYLIDPEKLGHLGQSFNFVGKLIIELIDFIDYYEIVKACSKQLKLADFF